MAKSKKTTYYYWDEVGCEVSKGSVVLPSGLTDKQIIALCDAHLSEQIGENEGMGTYGRKVSREGKVIVMRAKFGRDMDTKMWVCPEDAKAAKALADKENETEDE
jgi:hypothetical protein